MRLAKMRRPLTLSIHRRGRWASQFPIKQPDCTRGVCYRVPLSYRVVATIGKASSAAGIVELPNESPPVLIDIKRTFAVKKVKNIDFDENTGRLQKVFVNKPSSLEAVAGLPLQIAKEIIKLPTELIQLRIKLINEQNQPGDCVGEARD